MSNNPYSFRFEDQEYLVYWSTEDWYSVGIEEVVVEEVWHDDYEHKKVTRLSPDSVIYERICESFVEELKEVKL